MDDNSAALSPLDPNGLADALSSIAITSKSSAMNEVLGTAELLESILVHVPFRDLLLSYVYLWVKGSPIPERIAWVSDIMVSLHTTLLI